MHTSERIERIRPAPQKIATAGPAEPMQDAPCPPNSRSAVSLWNSEEPLLVVCAACSTGHLRPATFAPQRAFVFNGFSPPGMISFGRFKS